MLFRNETGCERERAGGREGGVVVIFCFLGVCETGLFSGVGTSGRGKDVGG